MTTIVHNLEAPPPEKQEKLERQQACKPEPRPNTWGDPQSVLTAFRTAVEVPNLSNGIQSLHPADRVITLRQIATLCTRAAAEQSKFNERFGMPDKTLSPAAAEAAARAMTKPLPSPPAKPSSAPTLVEMMKAHPPAGTIYDRRLTASEIYYREQQMIEEMRRAELEHYRRFQREISMIPPVLR